MTLALQRYQKQRTPIGDDKSKADAMQGRQAGTKPLPRDPDNLAGLLSKRAMDASSTQYVLQNRCVLNTAFRRGRQWLEIGRKDGSIRSITEGQSDVIYTTDNQIRPLLMSNTARCAGTLPDVSVAGLTDSPQDIAAADEANSILAHVNRNIDRMGLLEEITETMQVCGIAIRKMVWNPKAEADVAVSVDAQGNVTKSARLPVGDVEEFILSPIDLFIDPKATAWHDAEYMIHYVSRSRQYCIDQYGVDPGPGGAGLSGWNFESLEMRLSNIAGDYNFKRVSSAGQVTVAEMWEKPSKRNQMAGRLSTFGAGKLMRTEAWPDPDKRRYPFIPVVWEFSPGSVWGMPLVDDLIPHQVSINRILTNADTQDANRKPMILAPDGVKIKPGSFTSPKNQNMIYHSRDSRSEDIRYIQPPENSSDRFALYKLHLDAMKVIAGFDQIADSSGKPVSANLSAAAMELQQNASTQKLAVPLHSIERSEEERANWILRKYKQKGSEVPRLLGLDANDIPGSAQTRLMRFNAFRQGECRAIVTPNSGWPKVPAAKLEQLERWYTAGIFGPPQSSAAAESFLEMQESVQASELIPQIVARIKQAEANQPNPQAAMLQAQEMKGQQAIQQAQAQSQIEEQQAGQEQAIKTQGEMERIQAETQAELQRDAQAHDYRMQEIAAKAQIDAQSQVHQTNADLLAQLHKSAMPTVSLTGPLDSMGIASGERLAGLQSAPVSEIKAQIAPPKPMAAGAKPGGSNASN